MDPAVRAGAREALAPTAHAATQATAQRAKRLIVHLGGHPLPYVNVLLAHTKSNKFISPCLLSYYT